MDNRSPEETYERRREQVRRAQRTHRERKANYIRSLENENTALRTQNAELHNAIQRYQQLLTQHGIPDTVLTRQQTQALPPDQLATVSFVGDNTQTPAFTQGIQAILPPPLPPYYGNAGNFPSSASSSTGGGPYTTSNTPPPPPSASSSSSSQQQQQPPPQNFNISQQAINFILALEHPCLPHHKDFVLPEFRPEEGEASSSSAGPTGHEIMLQSPIMTRMPDHLHPRTAAELAAAAAAAAAAGSGGATASSSSAAAPAAPAPAPAPPDAQWTVPAGELQALLRYSKELGLDDTEVTPVQAWQIMTRHSKFVFLSFERLEQLKQGLVPLVKCYGFGAVMDRSAFEEVMDRLFASVDPF